MTISDQKIVPHLWYDKGANEAAAFYASIFPNSKVLGESFLRDTPSGDTSVVAFRLWGQEFLAINGGPAFTFNPSISLMVNFDPSREKNASEKLTDIWNKLCAGGTILMPLAEYPFSKKYGWVQDKYGLSWQLILTNPEGDERPEIIPSFMFVNDNCGKAEEARHFYLSIFKETEQGHLSRYPKGMEPQHEGSIMFSDFSLLNLWFTAMDSALDHTFNFNEAISFMVYCESQEEIDYYWNKLSAVSESEQCGWLKDKYGVSWQIVPQVMKEMMATGSAEQINRMNQAILKMKKPNIKALQQAYKG